jgi:phosphatidylserine decarboxylase
MRFASEGHRHMATSLVLVLVLYWAAGASGAFVGLVLAGLVINFFRDPERQVPADPKAIVSPADGKVIKVEKIQDDRFLNGPATMISIFMSPLDVHINRIPWSGRVVDVRYNPGKYLRAFADKASLDNEQTAVVMEDAEKRRFAFVQIAGFIARRIICRLKPGMDVERGSRYGMIMFGSRADIFLPPEAVISVKLGDRTQAAQTILARWP